MSTTRSGRVYPKPQVIDDDLSDEDVNSSGGGMSDDPETGTMVTDRDSGTDSAVGQDGTSSAARLDENNSSVVRNLPVDGDSIIPPDASNQLVDAISYQLAPLLTMAKELAKQIATMIGPNSSTMSQVKSNPPTKTSVITAQPPINDARNVPTSTEHQNEATSSDKIADSSTKTMSTSTKPTMTKQNLSLPTKPKSKSILLDGDDEADVTDEDTIKVTAPDAILSDDDEANHLDLVVDDAWQSDTNLRRRQANIDKFDPSSELPAKLWLELFEMITDGLKDERRIPLLATYLTKDRLRWFAQFIAPTRKKLTWTSVRKQFMDKFARDDVKPLVAAKDRSLKSTEAIQTYFDDKIRLLELAEVPVSGIIDLLTDGLPDNYRSMLISRDPRTTSEWLRCAQLFEFTRRTEKKSVNMAQVPKSSKPVIKDRDSNVPPTSPCPRCLEQSGIHAYHWLKFCTLPRTKGFESKPKQLSTTTASSNLNLQSGPSRA